MVCVYFFLFNFTKGGYIKCNIFLKSKGNKMNFTHIIVNSMGKQHVELINEIRLNYCIKGQNV